MKCSTRQVRKIIALIIFAAVLPNFYESTSQATDSAIILNNAPAQVCFTPGEDCTGLIVDAIRSARKEILVQAYGFTSKPIAEALVKAHRRGVQIVAVLDRSNDPNGNSRKKKKYTAAAFLANMGIPTYIDRNHKIAHNKVMVIDDGTVITGSFNFTKAAQKDNAENVLIIKAEKLARSYKANIEAHLQHSDKISSNY